MSVYLAPFMISIFITNETYDYMSQCTKEMYKSSVEYDECDYNTASAIFHSVDNKTIDIKIRRKGTSTWKDMNKKPSFKVKIENENVDFGVVEKGMYENWKTDKITLNNKISETNALSPFGINTVGEKVAYDVFKKIGVITPLTRDATVTLYRGQEKLREDEYLMVETIKNKDFVEKHWGEDTDVTIWEIENSSAVCKKDYGPLADCDKENKNEDIILSLSYSNYKDIGRYFAGEKLTGHWDASCRVNNMWVANVSGDLVVIPSGLDQTFQCNIFNFENCNAHQACMSAVECETQYKDTLNNYNKSDAETIEICSSSGLSTGIIVGIVVGVFLVTIGIVFINILYLTSQKSGIKPIKFYNYI